MPGLSKKKKALVEREEVVWMGSRSLRACRRLARRTGKKRWVVVDIDLFIWVCKVVVSSAPVAVFGHICYLRVRINTARAGRNCLSPYRMIPVPISSRNAHPSPLLNTLVNVVSYYAPCLLPSNPRALSQSTGNVLVRRDSGPTDVRNIIFPILIPILVLLSGLFAGLTLGYMSLDETQLNVLSISGTPWVFHICATNRTLMQLLIATSESMRIRSSLSGRTGISCLLLCFSPI